MPTALLPEAAVGAAMEATLLSSVSSKVTWEPSAKSAQLARAEGRTSNSWPMTVTVSGAEAFGEAFS